MSYWTYMLVDTGGPEPATVDDIGNMTSNVAGIWADALGKSLSQFEGMSGAEFLPIIEAGIAKLKDPTNEAKYRSMEPNNKWGSLESATKYLEAIRDACANHPKAYFHASC